MEIGSTSAQRLQQHAGDARQFGTTDDVAIFFDDTFDSELTKCVTNSPSAIAILSPQRMPVGHAYGSGSGGKHTYVDVTEYDPGQMLPGYQAGMSSSARKHRRAVASDITNGSGGVRLLFGGTSSKGGPATSAAATTQNGAAADGSASGGPSSLNTSTTAVAAAPQPSSASAAFIAAQQVEIERLEKERNRYAKMYEHQKAMYEEMAAKQHESYQQLQNKIVEVVALSTRNEESKRFIRQLKREMLDCKTRTLDLHNKALEDLRSDRASEDKYQAILQQQEQQFALAMESMQGKMAGLESVVKDLTSLHRDSPSTKVQVGQLDMLLRSAYAKNAALFGDLFKQGRLLELTTERKMEAERSAESLRRERRDAEAAMALERRRMAMAGRQHAEQLAELQQTVLDLRQLLVRTLDVTDSSGGSSEESGDEYGPGYAPAADREADAPPQHHQQAERAPLRGGGMGGGAMVPECPSAPVMYHRPQRRMLAVPATPPHCGTANLMN